MRVRTVAAWAVGAVMGAAGARALDGGDAAHVARGRASSRRAAGLVAERAAAVDWVALGRRTGSTLVVLGRRAAEGYRDGRGTT